MNMDDSPGRSKRKADVDEDEAPPAKKCCLSCKCGKTFARQDNFKRHVGFTCKLTNRNKNGASPEQRSRLTCTCGKKFTRNDNFRRHVRLVCKLTNKVFTCKRCDFKCEDCSSLLRHELDSHVQEQKGSGLAISSGKRHRYKDESALKGNANTRQVFPRGDEKYDLLTFFANSKPEVIDHLKRQCTKLKQIK